MQPAPTGPRAKHKGIKAMGKPNTNAATQPANTAPVAPVTAPVAPTPVLGKYARFTAFLGSPHALPNKWRYASTALVVGQFAPQSATSVMGIIYGFIAANPGTTGASLVAAMQGPLAPALAKTNAVKYASNGLPCALWCVGYINGACRASHGHLQPK